MKSAGLKSTLLAFLALFFSAWAVGRTYPSRPVKIIVPFAAGGPADNFARFIGQRMGDSLGQPFVVENRPGGGSVIGTDVVAKAAPDGYTLLLMSNAHTVNETLLVNKPFNLTRDFVGVAPINSSELVLVVHPSVKAGNLKELIAMAKVAPGKFNYAMLGNGSASHLAGIELAVKTGVALTFVPYKGGAPALADVAAGQTQALAIAMLSTYPFIRGGKLKLLAVMSNERLSFLPDVPTLAEAGVPGLVAGQWQALYGPKGMPREIIERIRAESVRYLTSPQTRKRFADQGAEVSTLAPEELTRFVAGEKAKFAKLVKDNNVTAD